jgi:hypothetical protein
MRATRRALVEAPADLQELEDHLPARTTDGYEELFGLDDALAAMPENLRRAILLREWQGLSYAEIAQALDISQSAVETLIFRARRHLAQALDQNVKQPARRVVSALNLGWLANALRGLLTGAGGAKLAAAGLGLVAAGLAGGGYAVSQALSESSTRPSEATAFVTTAAFVGAEGSRPGPAVARVGISANASIGPFAFSPSSASGSAILPATAPTRASGAGSPSVSPSHITGSAGSGTRGATLVTESKPPGATQPPGGSSTPSGTTTRLAGGTPPLVAATVSATVPSTTVSATTPGTTVSAALPSTTVSATVPSATVSATVPSTTVSASPPASAPGATLPGPPAATTPALP